MARNFLWRKPLAFLVFVACFGVLIFGCGGGGGAGGGSTTSTTASGTTATSTNSTNGNFVDVQLVGVFQGTQSPVNTANASVGDHIQFEYVGTSSTNSGVHGVATGGPIATNAPATVANLAGNVLTVLKASGGTSYLVTGSFKGGQLSQTLVTVAPLARVSGFVKDGSGNPVFGITVFFYGASGQVGTAVTGIDGSFIGEVPTTATKFSVDFSQFTSFYNEYSFGNSNFSFTTAGCQTPLPKLTAGVAVALPHNIVPFFFDPNDPPPPPTGCG